MEETTLHTGNESDGILKIVLYGPESTGKTTLAQDLAAYYQTLWVPEYMRIYLEEKRASFGTSITQSDLVPIAKGQLILEEKALKEVKNLLICDTNLLEIKVYSKYYYNGFVPDFILKEATRQKYDIYLLTYIDVPWEPDPLRDRPHHRAEMFHLFEKELISEGAKYHIIKGNRAHRLQESVKIIDQLIAEKMSSL